MSVQSTYPAAYFLDRLRGQFNLPSDYAIGKHYGASQHAVSAWRSGRSGFSDGMAMQVADDLHMPRLYVVACMHAHRARSDDVRLMWARSAAQALRAGRADGLWGDFK